MTILILVNYMYYINIFFLYSIVGYMLESLFFLLINSKKNSGFLYGWWTPVYGIGTIVSILLFNYVNKRINNKYIKIIILFVLYFIVFSILEYVGGVILEKIYHYEFWDYSDKPLNIGKYVCVMYSLLWSVMAFIYLYFLKSISDKFIKYIPKFVTYILILLYFVDNIFSLLKAFK